MCLRQDLEKKKNLKSVSCSAHSEFPGAPFDASLPAFFILFPPTIHSIMLSGVGFKLSLQYTQA